MHVTHLSLENYRSYERLVVEFPTGVVVLHGRNGRGKTNIVEALGYLSTLASHRVAGSKALIRNGEQAAVIRAKINATRESLVEVELVSGGANRARLNRVACTPREVLGTLRTVTFAPEDVQILRGEPGLRRRFLDQAIIQMKPSYAGIKRDFDRVLVQRGAALKEASRSGYLETLDVWDDSLAALSAQVAAHRLVLLNALRSEFGNAYASIADDTKQADLAPVSKLPLDGLDIPQTTDGYFPNIAEFAQELEAAYGKEISERRSEEVRRRQNLVGAHREDLEVIIDDLPVKGYASHGETWSAALALRLALAAVLKTDGQLPVLILDDVFAELDEKRRLALAENVSEAEQVFITSAVKDDLPELSATHFAVLWDQEGGSRIE